MTAQSILQAVLFFAVVTALAYPLGQYMARVYSGESRLANRILGPVERLFYRAAGVRESDQMDWKQYTLAVLLFNALGMLLVYALLRFQHLLPVNPAGNAAQSPQLAFNTAASFTSNTNWQSYAGETGASYLSQMLALTVQNFVSAATGMAIAVALIRGIVRKTTHEIGNFWVDMTKSTLYILLPLSFILAIVLVSQGVVQTFGSYVTAHLIESTTGSDGSKVVDQIIAVGPAASQIAIKQLGTNGGGFFNANSAHPFENPNALTNFIEMVSIILIGAAFCFTFGSMVRDKRQGWMLFAVMSAIFVPLMFLTIYFEQHAPPNLALPGVDVVANALHAGGNMEGKEARFGIANSAIWAAATTAASNGSVNAMHDSFTPLGGMIPLILIQLGEIIFGGVGSGLYGIILYAIIAVFIAGLMVGRTPEFLGKKIESYEMKMASLGILIPNAAIKICTALACVLPIGTIPLGNGGAHGFTEMLYAFSSAANNNGSAFGGLNASDTLANGTMTYFYTVSLGLCMLISRYWIIVPVLAIAGSLAKKKSIPVSAGTLPTHTPLFVTLVVFTILLIGALTFFPPLALGPIAEHLAMIGK
jgi:K+-transporting ATPase ATPase A chain